MLREHAVHDGGSPIDDARNSKKERPSW